MAQVPLESAPSVAPRTEAPDDLQRIPTSPNMFGGLIAQGEQNLGKDLTQTSDTGFQAAKFWGEVQTDGAINDTMKQVNGIVDNYRTLRGADALSAQASTNKQIQDAFDNGRKGLTSKTQQYQYDQTTRMYQERYIAGIISSHAAQQGQEHATKVNNDSFALALNGVATVADNDDAVQPFLHDARSAMVKQVHIEGNENDPDAIRQAISKADQIVYKTQAESLGVKDPAAALALVEKHKTDLGSYYPQLADSLRNRANQAKGIGLGQQAISGAGNDMTAPQQAPVSINEAILKQESGGRNISNPAQVQPATWQQYAKPGEDINNPADSIAVGNRIIDDLKSKYPDDPARVAVGYFSGPGNIAPPGSTAPYLNNYTDKNGKSVSSYVADVTKRTASPAVALRANAYDRIMSSGADPEVQAHALSYVRQQYDAAQVASLADAKAKKDASDQAANGYITQLMKSGATPDMVGKIAGDPNLDWPTKDRLWNIIESHAKSGAEGDAAKFGSGYYDALKKLNLPAGDPDRVNSVSQLVARGGEGGDLNSEGISKLSSIMQSLAKPDGTANAKMEEGAIAYAKHQLSFAEDYGSFKIPDPNGEDAFNIGFLPAFYASYDAGIANGKTPSQLLSKDSPDFIVDKIVGAYRRAPAEWLRDRLNAGVTSTDDKSTPPDMTSQAGIVASYKARKIDRQTAADALIKGGFAVAPAPVAAPQAPMGP